MPGTATDTDLGPEGTDEIRTEWLIQAQHQMAVMDAERVYFGVLIGGIRFGVWIVERNQPLIDIIVERTGKFWQMVQNGTPPEPSWTHETTPEILAAIGWEPEEEEPVDCPVIRGAWEQYEAASKTAKDYQRTADAWKEHAVKLLGSHNRALLGDGKILRRKLIIPKPPTEIPKPRSPYFDLRKVNE